MLELLNYSHSTSKHRFNVYRCSHCGSEKTMRQRNPQHESCGCLMGNFKHGHERGKKPTPELKCYRKVRERCYSPNCKDYVNYGGRGIEICPRWLDSFENFFSDMGPRPSKKHSIERRDVNGHYSPLNCYWATKDVQANNTRASRFVTLDGRKQTVTQWCRELGVSKHCFYRRLKRGMTPEQALSA